MKKFLAGVIIFTLVLFIGKPEARAFSISNIVLPTYFGTITPTDISNGLNSITTEINNTFNKYNSNDLAIGFGNANTYASHAGTMRAFQGYDLFTISVGTMVGVQAPTLDPGYFSQIQNDLMADGDIYAGMAWQPWTVQVGLNSSFLLEDLYLAAKFGYFNFNSGGFSFNTFNIGVLGNYQLIREKSLFLNVLVWRGVSVGSGLIYQSTKAGIDVDLTEIASGDLGTNEILWFDPDVTIAVDMNSVVIPLEITTAVRLLWVLNISVGAGMDLVFGESKVVLEGNGSMYIGDANGTLLDPGIQTPGSFGVDGNVTKDPEVFRPKLMANIGLGIGPVVIDVPVTWYLYSGANVGITVGIVW